VAVDEAAKGLAGEFQAQRPHAGVVCEAFLGQHIQGPQIALREPAAGRAVASDRDAGSFLQGFARASDVLAKLLRRHLAYMAVKKSFAGDLVAAADDLGDHLRLVFADPTQDEEGRLRSDLVQEVERQFGVAVNPAFEARPVVRGYDPADRCDVTIVLQHDREDMSSHRTFRNRG
jgi:hypothetical protein